MEVYFGGAEDVDITEEELAAVRAMVMAVSAGRIFFQSKMVLQKMKAPKGEEDSVSECGPECCD